MGVKQHIMPVGESDYAVIVNSYYYVDKTLMIRDVLDQVSGVFLFTRPRRFGKSTNMSMLKTYFEKADCDTAYLFQDKLIWGCGDEYTSEQGKYPVIALSFKSVSHSTWEGALENIRILISNEFKRHRSKLDWSDMDPDDRAIFERIATKKSSIFELQDSLRFLAQLLHDQFKERVIILIDEYDAPVQYGYSNGYYPSVIEFVRVLLVSALKDNSIVRFGFLTGILRVTKESIFSGLNNVTVFGITSKEFASYFGFTQAEVEQILKLSGMEDKIDEVKEWYDSYKFGDQDIYNPWSIGNYVRYNTGPVAHWVETGATEQIKNFVANANSKVLGSLTSLMNGNGLRIRVNEHIIYPRLTDNAENIFSFLLMAGYLKATDINKQGYKYDALLSVPNKEVMSLYVDEISEAFKDSLPNNTYEELRDSIENLDFEKLRDVLARITTTNISVFDSSTEGFFHGLLLCVCVLTANNYCTLSNRESGTGRYDVALYPLKEGIPAIIFELKHATGSESVEDRAADALKQINARAYETDLHSFGHVDVLKVGIAFKGKGEVSIKYQRNNA